LRRTLESHARLHPRPELVLFDLDNTLCDYDGARLARTRYALEACLPDPEHLEEAIAAALADPTDGDEHFAAILAGYGLTDAGVLAEVRARYVEDRYLGLALFDEALEVVTEVARHARVGLVTNGPATIQRPKIELLALEAHFPVIVVSEEVGVWKPDPRIFEIALERSGVAPSRAIYVGDSAHHDIPGARAAGLGAVWINRKRQPWLEGQPPDAEIHTLYDLLELLGL
jgi:HAD superfamily hydrolase (TIGR01509 family)